MSEAGHVHCAVDDGVATLWISNPERRNAFSQSMWLELEAILIELLAREDVRVLLLRGEGGRAFSAGADIAELQCLLADAGALGANNLIIRRVQLALEVFPRPTVALIEGACVGGGFGIALACDLRFASPRAKFAVTPSKLGLLYSLPDTRRMLRTLGPTLTRDLLLSGRIMGGEEAWDRGFLTALCAEDELESHAGERVAELANASASALSGIKRTLNHLEGVGDDSAEDLDALFSAAFTSADCREGAAAFLEKRGANFNRGEDSS